MIMKDPKSKRQFFYCLKALAEKLEDCPPRERLRLGAGSICEGFLFFSRRVK